jgi:hypothetical protein
VIGAAVLNLLLHLGTAVVDHFIDGLGERAESVFGSHWLAAVPALPPGEISGEHVTAVLRHVVKSEPIAVLAATKVLVVLVI